MYNYDFKRESNDRINNLVIELNKMDGKFVEDIFDKFYKKLDKMESKNNEQQV